jgi:hypothetical protein
MAKYIKPTLDTKFHIDFEWWQKTKQALKIDLNSHACAEVQEQYDDQPHKTFDWIDPDTGQVFNIDLMWYLVHTHCSQQPDFIDSRMPLTTAIFCTFIANDNTPLTAVEIYERLQKKTPELILGTIGGRKVYKGIRPVATG